MHQSDQYRHLLAQLEYAIEAAQDRTALLAVIDQASQFNGPLQPDRVMPQRKALLLLAAILPWSYFCWPFLGFGWLMGVLGAITGSYLLLLGPERRYQQLQRLSDRLFQKDTLLNHALTPEPVDGVDEAEALAAQFNEFDRDRDAGSLSGWFSGHQDTPEPGFAFQMFQHHFTERAPVEGAEVPEDEDGELLNTILTQSLEHYRNGILVQLPENGPCNVQICADDSLTMSAVATLPGLDSDDPFALQFRLAGDTEWLDTLLDSKTRERLVTMLERLDGLHLEVNNQGRLCLSFADHTPLPSQRQYGLDNPEAFAKELCQSQGMPKLKYALEHLESLLAHWQKLSRLKQEAKAEPVDEPASQRVALPL
ncbi:hypothetical protein [Ferrimonas marina]|uniref:DUF3137 domain-containing protein n=1 Tax=Ferrimonas marina TaxID=299255 RepID=A0A1M5NPT5_9GAMM|nr:hypothetical protein [Ferrimonas marina]SHG91508.1 hypothetical protein SAMN02745129_1136 [Ferrimonas marina]